MPGPVLSTVWFLTSLSSQQPCEADAVITMPIVQAGRPRLVVENDLPKVTHLAEPPWGQLQVFVAPMYQLLILDLSAPGLAYLC